MRALLAGLLAGATAFIAVALITAGDDEPGRAKASPAGASSGAALFASMGCGSCHRFAATGSDAEFGPSLDERLPAHTRDSLRAAIVNPPANGMMPTDFGSRMRPAEIDTLVSYLLRSAR